jgi:hypothetical protein
VSQHARSTFVVTDHSEILAALVGLKDVELLYLERRGPEVELAIELKIGSIHCQVCGVTAQ